ncbi:MAG: hypothetical protein RIB93_26550 [Coleofasciculus sp. D1-CHI-01]|uniref:hypothetical protein n=1 Tax=Coleofasciculus sp. D1-CHI-01 TaxID=3068482 RepID=UPI0033001F64
MNPEGSTSILGNGEWGAGGAGEAGEAGEAGGAGGAGGAGEAGEHLDFARRVSWGRLCRGGFHYYLFGCTQM